MRYASSIRYGGELIEAEDCDYESYKSLGLLCPECRDPVFLRAEGTRQVKGKDVKIGAHFSHFPGKDPAIVLACENRIKSYNTEDLERKANQSRGQRLKLIQRWFYEVIKATPLFKEGRQKAEQLGWVYLIDPQEVEVDDPDKYLSKIFENTLQNCISLLREERLKKEICIEFDRMFAHAIYTKELSQKLLTQSISETEAFVLLKEFGSIKEDDLKYHIEMTRLDRRMQKLICCEILDFLSTPRTKPILSNILLYASALSEFHHVYEYPEYLHELYKGATDKGDLSFLCQMIAQVPWQTEFERLKSTNLVSEK
jgi:hypothetical protein